MRGFDLPLDCVPEDDNSKDVTESGEQDERPDGSSELTEPPEDESSESDYEEETTEAITTPDDGTFKVFIYVLLTFISLQPKSLFHLTQQSVIEIWT